MIRSLTGGLVVAVAAMTVMATPAFAHVGVSSSSVGPTGLASVTFTSSVLTSSIDTPTQPSDTEAPSTTRSTLVPGEAAVTKEGSPINNAGLVVGLVAVGAIVAGALGLFLRYRGKGNTTRQP